MSTSHRETPPRRTRPTRDETRQRLLAAAAEVFVDRGIAAATIEDICDAAGFSRGAFYSNFSAKDDLVLELLDAHLDFSQSEMERLYGASPSPADFLLAMESPQRRREGPLDIEGGQILRLELLLYALRNPDNRPRLVAHQRRTREHNRDIISRIVEAVGREYPAPLDDVATLIMGFDEGLSLLQLVDPDSYRDGQFSDTVVMLHQMWLDSAPQP